MQYYDKRLLFIPEEDVKQEIRIAILTAPKEQVYRVARQLCERLASDYGYSRKKGKDQFAEFYKVESITAEQEALLTALESAYQSKTVKQICAEYNVPFSNRVQKLFTKNFPKKCKQQA